MCGPQSSYFTKKTKSSHTQEWPTYLHEAQNQTILHAYVKLFATPKYVCKVRVNTLCVCVFGHRLVLDRKDAHQTQLKWEKKNRNQNLDEQSKCAQGQIWSVSPTQQPITSALIILCVTKGPYFSLISLDDCGSQGWEEWVCSYSLVPAHPQKSLRLPRDTWQYQPKQVSTGHLGPQVFVEGVKPLVCPVVSFSVKFSWRPT